MHTCSWRFLSLAAAFAIWIMVHTGKAYRPKPCQENGMETAYTNYRIRIFFNGCSNQQKGFFLKVFELGDLFPRCSPPEYKLWSMRRDCTLSRRSKKRQLQEGFEQLYKLPSLYMAHPVKLFLFLVYVNLSFPLRLDCAISWAVLATRSAILQVCC